MTRTRAPAVPPPGRRSVLAALAGAALGAAGCSGRTPPATHPSHTPPAPHRSQQSSTGAGSPSPSPALPRTTPWRPTSAEVQPAAKLRAVQVVEAIGAWGDGHGGAAAARARVAALG
ncbi:hypothetical protein ABZX53_36190, partial [Streptomyces sp. NPDC004546]